MNLFGEQGIKKASNKNHFEDELQKACFRFMELQFPKDLIFHIPNGGKRDKREAGKFKDMGVRPGVSDLISLSSRRGYDGFVCELKHGTNGTTESQDIFLKHAEQENKYTCLCRTVEQFVAHAYYYFGNGKTDKKPQRGY